VRILFAARMVPEEGVVANLAVEWVRVADAWRAGRSQPCELFVTRLSLVDFDASVGSGI